MNRAWSLFEIKSFDDEERSFEGIASTPVTDRMGDIVEPKGARFKLPLTMLWQHGKGAIKDPVGWIVSAKVTNDQISVKGQFAKPKSDYPQSLTDELNSVWVKVRDKIVRGLSIGFRPIESEPIKGELFAERFTAWEWLELSPVSVAANQDASITSVKSADTLSRAASGNAREGAVVRLHLNLPGVSGQAKGSMTIQEQITQFENKRAASAARMDAIMTKAGETGSTLDDTEQEEYDGLDTEIQSIDKHLVRLKAHQARLATTAKEVTKENTSDTTKAAETRGGVVQVTSAIPKGLGFARAVIALANCKGNRYEASEFTRQRWPEQSEGIVGIIKAEQLPGTVTGTTWAAPLMQSSQRLVGEYIEMLRPASIVGRIPNLKRVPFNVSVPVQTGGGTYNWVGENRPKPVSGLSLTTATLRLTKIAGIIPYTKEALRLSDPSIEMTVRNDMIAGTARFMDAQFIDPAVHDSIGVNPPSITDQIVPTAASGLTATAFRNDMRNIMGKFITNNEDPTNAVLLMSATVAANLASMQNALGQSEFSTITLQGGSFMGIPIIVSQAVGARIILLNPTEILIAEDPGGASIDISEEASVVMTTTPEASPQATSLVSFWQNNLIGLRVDLFVTWKRALTTSVEYISSAVYSG